MTKYTDFINYNLSMLTDHIRTETYRRALLQTVKSHDVILDLGCGTGILTFFACQAGAQRVYAIESEDVIELAKQVCAKNGLQDRTIFVRDPSFRVELPEKVDVLVTETIGTFGLDEGILGSVIDARDRFLRKDGAIIPRSIQLFMVPVELPGFYEHMIDFWASDRYGLDFSPVRRLAANNFHPIRLSKDTFLSEPVNLLQILLTEAKSSDVRSEVSFYGTRRGKLHGIAGWFIVEVTKGIFLSNAPESVTSHWGLAFFPLDRPVAVERGNLMRLAIESTGNGSAWNWQVEVNEQRFNQSTLWGFPQTMEEPHKLLPTCRPRLSRRGQAELFLLSLFSGEKTISELEQELRRQFPDLIRSQEQASASVQEVVRKCT